MKKKLTSFYEAAMLEDLEKALLEDADGDRMYSPELVLLDKRLNIGAAVLEDALSAMDTPEQKDHIQRVCRTWWDVGIVEGMARQRLCVYPKE